MKTSNELAEIAAFSDQLTFEGETPSATHPAYAVHTRSSRRVVVVTVSKRDIAVIMPWRGVHHAHLADVLEIVQHSESEYWVAVARINGELLNDRLLAVHKKHPVDAVRTALRVADALATLHEAGGAHGRLHPGTVLLSPEQGREPLVTFGVAGSREYWPPDYSIEAPACARVDTWATGALLFHMLTGSTPPAMGVANADDLRALGIENALLRGAIAHTLNRDSTKRADNLQPLRRELARWFVEHVGEEPGPHSVVTKPPPLPASMIPQSSAAKSQELPHAKSARPKSSKVSLVLAGVAAILGLTAAWGFSALRKPKPVVVEWQRHRTAPQVPSNLAPHTAPSAIDLAEVPVSSKDDKPGAEVMNCISAFLPEATLSPQANLSGYCAANDLRQAMRIIRSSFASIPAGWNELGWFELAALSTFRASCCGSSPPRTIWPVPTPDCPSISDALDRVGRTVSAAQNADDAISQLKDAARCEMAKGKPDVSRPTASPSSEAEQQFRRLFHL